MALAKEIILEWRNHTFLEITYATTLSVLQQKNGGNVHFADEQAFKWYKNMNLIISN